MFEHAKIYLYMNMKKKRDISSILYITIMIIVFALAI